MSHIEKQKRALSKYQYFWYPPILAFSMFLMMSRVFISAHALSVEDFGSFSLGLLISNSFGMLRSLGMQITLQRELPILLSKKKFKLSAILVYQCSLLTLACALILMVSSIIVFYVSVATYTILFVGLLHGFCQQLFLIYITESRSNHEVGRFSLQNLQRALLLFITSSLIASFTRSPSLILIIESCISLLISIPILASIIKKSSVKHLNILLISIRRLPKIQWKVSGILLLTSIASFILSNLDRWMAASLLSRESFAIYSFLATAFVISQMIQSLINTSVFPAMVRLHNKTGKIRVFNACMSLSVGTFTIWIILAFIFQPIISFCIDQWFPKYDVGLTFLPFLSFIAGLRISDYWSSFLIITQNESKLLMVNALSIIFSSISWLTYLEIFRNGESDMFGLVIFACILGACNYFMSMGASYHLSSRSYV